MAQFLSGRRTNLNIGISSVTENTSVLNVTGNANISGILTASRIFSSTYGEFTGGNISGTNLVGTALSISGISTLNAISVGGTTGISQYVLTSTGTGLIWQAATAITGVTGINVVEDATGGLKYLAMQTGAGTTQTNNISSNQLVYNSTTKNLGIGTTNPTSKLTVQGDAKFTGVVTATTFIGNLTGTATTATNLAGGAKNSIPYQTGVNTTGFISYGNPGDILTTDGVNGAPYWAPLTIGAVVGQITVRDEGNVVGSATSITQLDFRGPNIVATANVGGNIATITVADYVSISGYSTNAGIATYATSSGIATYATNAGIATYATNAGIATYATNAGIATYAPNAGIATYATNAGIATYATNAGIATYATNAGIATYAPNSGIATYATSAGIATYATNAGIATYAPNAGIATYAPNAGIATYAPNAGIATYATTAGIATYATNAGIATNIKGGAGGSIPYQTGTDTTALLANGSAGNLLQSNGTTLAPSWASPQGLTIGYANTAGIATYATNAGIATNVIGGIASVTSLFVDTLGISTLGTVKISSGIVTATTGIVTYYGDGSNLTNLPTSIPVDTIAVNAARAITFIPTGVATTSRIGVNLNYLSFVPSNGGLLGINTNNPQFNLHVFGNGKFVGNVTADNFYGTASYATTSGIATYATNIKGGAGGSLPYQSATDTTALLANGSAGQLLQSNGTTLAPSWASPTGLTVGYANTAGIASVATKLQTPRVISLTGDVAGSVSFDGSGDVSIASTIQPNSVALGSDTTGDYVQSITGTANQISVSVTSGEGSAPTLSIPNQFTAPQDVTVTRDLQVNRNLNVSGNITIGGTSAIIYAQQLKVSDSDLILGIRTDAFGNDISNDTTANHGGIAIASTEGSPLANFNVAGIETLPPTYKKIMWFKSGSFAGLNTDAWLTNYAFGVGTTQMPSGARFSTGNFVVGLDDITSVRNINSTGIISATKFDGPLDATSALSQRVGFATTATNLAGGTTGNVPYQSNAGITTFVTNPGVPGKVLLFNGSVPVWGDVSSATGSFGGISVQDETNPVGTSGSITTLNFVGGNISATATTGVNGIATITIGDNLVGTALSISGISTLGTVEISSGIITATTGIVTYYGDGSKLSGINASGSVSISTNTTNQSQYLTYATGTGSTTGFGITTTGLVFNPSSNSLGIGTTNPTSKLWVDGDGYFTGILTANRIFSTNLVGTALSVSGISTSSEFVGGGSDLRNLSGTHLVSYASASDISNSALSIAGISTYSQVGILTGSYAVDSTDGFGNAVATSADGKTIIVGASADEIGATTSTGVVYVFDRVGNSFNQVGILTGSLATSNSDIFGHSVATSADGKTIIVGALNDELPGLNGIGLVYVFDRVGNSFNQVGILTGSYAVDTSDRFGYSVATSADGKTIIVGAYSDEIGATASTGVVYVFDRVGNSFNQVGILTGSYAVDSSDNFGYSVATSADGKTIIVGTSADEIGATASTGLVYVFGRVGNSFNQVGILTGSLATTAGDGFGNAVATSADGKTIIVGTSADEIGATASTGIAYVFDQTRQTYVYSGPTGNIGIGTTNPTSKLTVVGDVLVSGVSTFQNNVNLTTNSNLTFGPSNNLQISYGGIANSIYSLSGTTLNIQGSTIQIRDVGSNNLARFSSSAELYYLSGTSSVKLATTNYGVSVTGLTSTTTLNVGTGGTVITTTAAGLVGIGTTNPPYLLTVTTSGATVSPSLSNVIADFTANTNSYSQINTRNASTGANASTDLIATADTGTDSTNYIDLGINNSGYSAVGWTINGPLDGYLYTSDTNLSIGAAGANKYVSVFTGGTTAANERLRVNTTGVGIGTTDPQSTLQVGAAITMYGPTGIVSATKYYGDGSSLTGVAAASADSYLFNTGITSSFSRTLVGIGSTIFTFPATAGKEYIVLSINCSNVSTGNTEVNVIGAFDFNGGERSYFAYNIPIPTGTAVEIMKQPQVMNASDRIVMRSTNFSRVGTDSIIETYITYQEKTSTSYFGVGLGTVGLATTDITAVYTSNTYPSVIQSIRLANVTDSGGYPVSVQITNGLTTTRLVDNLIVPKYASVEILDAPKRIEINSKIEVQLDQGGTMGVQVSGSQITS